MSDREGVDRATMPSNMRAGQKTKEKIEMLISLTEMTLLQVEATKV